MPVLAIHHQVLNPTGSLIGSTLLALVPVAFLLVMLAVFRVTAWLSVLLGSILTFVLGVFVWHAPIDTSFKAYLYGSLTGVWAVDWITFWGVVIFYTLQFTGLFENFEAWLVAQATSDIRIQTILLAWAFGALLEGLVGFGYPWAVVAPLLIAFGVAELDAIRVAAIANNAPVSYGALGAPIIALAAVTQIPLLTLSASVGKIVAVLALLPPFVLIYLVSGWRGLRTGWPLAIVGALAYIAGQFPTSQFLGPYLPDVVGSLVCFAALLLLLRVWRPRDVLGYGGVVMGEGRGPLSDAFGRRRILGGSTPAAPASPEGRELSGRELWMALLPFIILIAVVVLWTGPWSGLPKYVPYKASVVAASSLTGKNVTSAFMWAPFIAGTAILASWILILAVARPSLATLGAIFKKTFQQMWGALLVGFFIFGLAYVFIYSGMSNTMAYGFSKLGLFFLVLAPILGWIGVALSGSNTSTNTLFGAFQLAVGKLLGVPLLLLPSLNSVGAEVGKPVAPQTTSVGVSTTSYVRNEGAAIRHNMGWTLVLLGYLIVIGLLYFFVFPGAMHFTLTK